MPKAKIPQYRDLGGKRVEVKWQGQAVHLGTLLAKLGKQINIDNGALEYAVHDLLVTVPLESTGKRALSAEDLEEIANEADEVITLAQDVVTTAQRIHQMVTKIKAPSDEPDRRSKVRR